MRRCASVFLLLGAVLLSGEPFAAETSYPLEVLPAEHVKRIDPETGAALCFLSSDPAEDTNLYYEQRSWLADSSLILFNSARERGGLMGYLTQTGELVRITTPTGGLGSPTAARERNRVFAVRGNQILEIAIAIDTSVSPTSVIAAERVIAELDSAHQPFNCALSESSDGRYISAGVGARGGEDLLKLAHVIVVETGTGAVRDVVTLPGVEFHGHVMFSVTHPHLLSYARLKGPIVEVVDIRTGEIVWGHRPDPKVEFATHHCWWVDGAITFCGGFHLEPNLESDVKVMDFRTGTVRIVGRGSWWPGAAPAELARVNWWHAAGHESGRWIAADNWHGDIGIFHGKTTRTYWLTRGHRTYGSGRHPEVGWDRRGEAVVFASHMLGNADVCVATLPQGWQDSWGQQ
ncbi:MAG: hypothetical protein HYV27_11380 [Candidatus Hydrogenedentes bacterium]|nr:hypothetical protein [Candidatus Hydrogenedentota bacterium]